MMIPRELPPEDGRTSASGCRTLWTRGGQLLGGARFTLGAFPCPWRIAHALLELVGEAAEHSLHCIKLVLFLIQLP